MTRLFARVRSAAEAEQAAHAGFDGIATDDPALATGSLARLFPAPGQSPALRLAEGAHDRTLMLFADRLPDALAFDAAVAAGAAGFMLGSRGRLLAGGLAGLAATRARCGTLGLLCGFSGGLEAPDAPRLLALAPDLLVFGAALRTAAADALDPAPLALVRDLVPREGGAPQPNDAPVAHHPPDRIFLRDLVREIAIGAYAGERGRLQRVRFSVEAELRPLGRATRDMRDVVSYDLFSDAIAALTTDRHVEFVETLAEEIAATVLAHPRVHLVRVTVEKLDIGPGAVGVTIQRHGSAG